MKSFAKCALPICTALFALVWIYFGLTVYGFWDAKKGPLGGFFPVLVASLLLLASIFALLSASRENLPVFRPESLHLIAVVLAIFAASYLVGMLPALALFLVMWLRWMEKYPWRTTLITAGVIFAVVIGIFALWLQVRFPAGLLFAMLNGR